VKKLIGIIKKVDLRDVLLVVGLITLWYGLFLFAPWVSFAVCGALLLAAAYLMPTKKQREGGE